MGRMNSGFAKQLRQKFPEAYLDYHNSHQDTPLQVGDVILTKVERPEGNFEIASAITQKFYGRNPSVVYVDYDAVEKTLKWVAEGAKKFNQPIHLPFIGGGLANGDQTRLMKIFESVFTDVDATLWLHTPIVSKRSHSWQ
jgi:hypothetical protein